MFGRQPRDTVADGPKRVDQTMSVERRDLYANKLESMAIELRLMDYKVAADVLDGVAAELRGALHSSYISMTIKFLCQERGEITKDKWTSLLLRQVAYFCLGRHDVLASFFHGGCDALLGMSAPHRPEDQAQRFGFQSVDRMLRTVLRTTQCHPAAPAVDLEDELTQANGARANACVPKEEEELTKPHLGGMEREVTRQVPRT